MKGLSFLMIPVLILTFMCSDAIAGSSNKIFGSVFVTSQHDYFDVVVHNISEKTLDVYVTFYDENGEVIEQPSTIIGWWQGFSEPQGANNPTGSGSLPSQHTGLVRIGFADRTIFGHFTIEWRYNGTDCEIEKGLIAWGKNLSFSDPVLTSHFSRGYAATLINQGKPF